MSGVYTDILASAKTFDVGNGDGIEGRDRVLVRALKALKDRQGDLAYPTGFDVANEVQSIAIHEAGTDGGTFTLTITLADGTTFTTAAIAFDAVAATIETAIDTAADGVVAGFTAGDIAVTGGPLTTDPLVLTFTGAAASQKPELTVITSSLTATAVPSDAGEVTVTTDGQTKRTPWAVLRVSGVISGTPPVQGTSDTVVAGSTRASNPHYPNLDLVRALAKEAAFVDGNTDVETAILAAADLG